MRTPEHTRKIIEARSKNPKWQAHMKDLNARKKGIKLTAEHKAKIGASGVGRKHSDETKKKIGLVHKGKYVTPETRAKMSEALSGRPNLKNRGKGNGQWKETGVSYRGLHHWVVRNKERLNICTRCNKEGITQFANISGEYKRDVDDFIELCVSCHRGYDLGNHGLEL